MNDDKLSTILGSIAEERIPDNMDLWNNIQQQLDAPKSNIRQFRKYRNRWLLVAIVAMMTMGVVGVLAQGGGEDPDIRDAGIRAAAEQGLVTEVNETQTVDNISVTLDYVYADANRLTTHFTAEGEIPVDEVNALYFTSIVEADAEIILTPISGGGGGGGGGSAVTTDATLTRFRESVKLDNYDLFSSEELPAELNLRVIVEAKLRDNSGQGFSDPANDETVATFSFEVTVPVYTGRSIAEPQSMTVNDVEMTLQDVIVTTTMTRVVLCFDAPAPQESAFPWSARPELAINGEAVMPEVMGWGSIPQDVVKATYGENCQAYFLAESLLERDGEWTLTVPALTALIPLSNEALNGRLEAEYDIIVIEDGNGVRFEGTDSQNIGEIIQVITEENSERLEGPWTFTFSLD